MEETQGGSGPYVIRSPRGEPREGSSTATNNDRVAYHFISQHSGKALTVKRGSKEKGEKLVQFDLDRSSGQEFYMEEAGEGFYYLIAAHSGLYLTAREGKGNGAIVFQDERTGKPSQQWLFVADVGGDGESCHIFSKSEAQRVIVDFYLSSFETHNFFQVMDVRGLKAKGNNATVHLWKYHGEANQRWKKRLVIQENKRTGHL